MCYLIVVLICIWWLMMLNIFPCACWPSLSSLEKMSIRIICSLKKNTVRVVVVFVELYEFFTFWVLTPYQNYNSHIFSPVLYLAISYSWYIYVCIYIYWFAKPFGLKLSHLFVFVCIAFAFGVKSKNLSPRPISRHLLSIFFWKVLWFQVLCSSLLIHVGLIFLCGVYSRCPVSSFCMWLSIVSLPQSIFLAALL